jgi:two-component system sensor histidine kinase CpxA
VKVRLPLYAQIFGMLSLYLLTLTAIVFITLNAQFGFGWDALIKSPLGDRVNTIADAVVGHLASSKKAQWNDVLKSYEKRHHLKFFLFDVFGHQLAGATTELPKTIERYVPEFGGPHRFGPWTRARIVARTYRGGPDHIAGQSLDGPLPPPMLWEAVNRTPVTMEKNEKKTMGAQAAQNRSSKAESVAAAAPSSRLIVTAPGGEPVGPDGMWTPPGEDMGPRPSGPPWGPPDSGGFPRGGRTEPPAFGMPPPPFFHEGQDPMVPPQFGPANGEPVAWHLPPEMMHAHGQFMMHSQNPDRFWICTRVHVSALDSTFPIPAVLVAESDNIWQNNLLFDTTFILEVAGALLAFSLIFWWPFVYSISHSLAKLTTATEAIAEGQFDTRLEVERGDEIGRLSDAVNVMAGRLASFVSGQKRFLGDISHELFSPLARLQMALELLDEDATENQKATVNDIREEVSEMNNLVNELLAFSKAGLKGREIELTVVNVRKIISESVDRTTPNDNFVVKVPGEPKAIADAVLLSRAVSNVLRNAVRYAGDKGPITVAVSSDRHTEQISIVISDCGKGVPEEALSRLAEPFFRPEASRSRSSGGVGLGLAIVKSCVEACNGTVAFRNRAQGGFEVEMRLQEG